MQLMTFNLFVWRSDDGTIGIDSRAMQYFGQWLSDSEIVSLVKSLSPQRLWAIDQFVREALCPPR